MEKYHVGTYHAMIVKSWGFSLSKKWLNLWLLVRLLFGVLRNTLP